VDEKGKSAILLWNVAMEIWLFHRLKASTRPSLDHQAPLIRL